MLDDARPDKAPDSGAPPSSPDAEACGIAWLVEARRMMEARETGRGDRRALLRALGRMNRRAPWTMPWCGLFVAHCLRAAMPEVPLPALPLRARPWKRWGEPVAPQLGALMLFWHYHPASPFGHVAFYWAEDAQAYHVLGGNQRHRVCVQRYPKSRFVAARWPEGVARPGLRRAAPPEAARPFG